MSYTFPWTVNKFFSTNINDANSVPGPSYGTNVSLKVNGKTELVDTVYLDGKLGVGKEPAAGYQVDVSGNVNATGLSVGGVPTTQSYSDSSLNLWTTTTSMQSRTGTSGVNTAYGIEALESATTCSSNTAVGWRALKSLTTGGSNIGIGNSAMTNLVSGVLCLGFGYQSGLVFTSAIVATCVGFNAGGGGVQGNYVNLFGNNTSVIVAGITNSTCLGQSAFIDASNQVAIGTVSDSTIVRGKLGVGKMPDVSYTLDVSGNVNATALSIGGSAVPSLSSNNTWTGANNFTTQALLNNTTLAATTAFTQSALNRILYVDASGNQLFTDATKFPATSTGRARNIGIGNCFQALTGGVDNTCVGSGSLNNLTTGTENFCMGGNSMRSVSTGSFNVVVGYDSLANGNVSECVAIGRYCLRNANGNDNTCIGYFSGVQVASGGANNTGVGAYSHQRLLSGSNNTAIGYGAGNTVSGSTISASNNTYLGANAQMDGGTTFTNSTCVGYNSRITASNAVFLGTASTPTTAMGGLIVPTGGITASATQTITFGSNAPTMAGTNITGIPTSAITGYGSGFVDTSSTQTIGGVKTFSSFPLITGSGFVHTTGAQSIGGVKTFTNAPVMSAGATISSGQSLTLLGNVSADSKTVSAAQVGYLSYANIDTTYNNQFFGLNSGSAITIPDSTGNCAYGQESLQNLAEGTNNTAVGYQAGKNLIVSGASTSDANTAIGHAAMGGGTGASTSNTAVGSKALFAITTGGGNTAVGKDAGGDQTTGFGSVFIGTNSTGGTYQLENCTLIGRDTGSSGIFFESTAIGYGAQITDDNGIFLGTASETTYALGALRVAGALSANGGLTVPVGQTLTLDGDLVANGTNVSNAQVKSLSQLNINATTNNVFLGISAAPSGSENVAFGRITIGTLTTGTQNTMIGSFTCNNLAGTSSQNTAVGYGALSGSGTATSASQNTAIGYQALGGITTGGLNVGIGYNAGIYQTTGSGTVYIGHNSGSANHQLTNCTLIGLNATSSGSGFTSSTAIGTSAQITASNQIILGTSSQTTFPMGGLTVPVGQRTTVQNQYLSSSAPFQTASFTVSAPYFEVYPLAPTATMTITLPAASATLLGLQMTFRRTAGTSTVAVNSATSNLYPTNSFTAVNTIMLGTSGFMRTIVCSYLTASTYGWFILV